MGRIHRIDVEGGWHHVMNRGVDRRSVFFDDADRIEFGRLLGEVFERFAVETIAYCLMSNHYHVVVHCPKAQLSDAMHLVGSVYTRHTNDRAGRDGPLFRGRFHAVPIVSDEQLLCTVRYVHRNALDLPGVDDVASYRWSSHRTYLGHRARPPFLKTDAVLTHFADSGAFDGFVRSDPAALESGRALAERLGPLVQLVADEVGAVGSQGSRAARSLLLLAADRLPEDDAAAVLEQLNFSTPKSQQQARHRARRSAAERPELTKIIDRVMQLVA